MACGKIVRYTDGLSINQFLGDDKTLDAVMRNLEVIGEAVKRLPADLTAGRPDVAWKEIAGMRDFIAHVYFALDLDVLWNAVQVEVPRLQSAVGDMLDAHRAREERQS